MYIYNVFFIYFGSTVTVSVHDTTRSPEEPQKTTKPTTKPAKPITKQADPITKPAKPTESDFFGDKYTTDDDLPQTVGI